MEDTLHGIFHNRWIEKLLEAPRDPEADAAALQYVTRLDADDKTSRFIRKRVGFFAELIRAHAGRLPQSHRFLNEHFTEAEIEPQLVIYKGIREAIRRAPRPKAKPE